MKQYYTRLITTDYALYPPTPYKGRGWELSFEDYPQFESASMSAIIKDQTYPGKTVIIHAGSDDRAQYISDLIYGSIFLWRGQQTFIPLRAEIIPIESIEAFDAPLRDTDVKGPIFYGSTNIPTACLITRKASFRRAYQNAIFKYLLSQEIFPTNQWDMAPSNWQPSQFVFNFPDHHTRCAYAIIMAYSVIEEISLEIRASPDRPSFVNGQWNPVVRLDIEKRLDAAGIDGSEKISWLLRDTPTRIERLKPPRALRKSKWSGGKVRDIELELVDAIAYSSWLRSKISAHRFHELTGVLSYYDVSNVHHLARRLLLQRLGFWNISGEIHTQ